MPLTTSYDAILLKEQGSVTQWMMWQEKESFYTLSSTLPAAGLVEGVFALLSNALESNDGPVHHEP